MLGKLVLIGGGLIAAGYAIKHFIMGTTPVTPGPSPTPAPIPVGPTVQPAVPATPVVVQLPTNVAPDGTVTTADIGASSDSGNSGITVDQSAIDAQATADLVAAAGNSG